MSTKAFILLYMGILLASVAVVFRGVEFVVSRNTFLCNLVTPDCSELLNWLSETWLQAHPIAVALYPRMLASFDMSRDFFNIFEPGLGSKSHVSVVSITFDAICIAETMLYGIILGLGFAFVRKIYRA